MNFLDVMPSYAADPRQANARPDPLDWYAIASDERKDRE